MKEGLHTSTHDIKCWYHNDQLHNARGPAIEYSDGRGLYCLYGVLLDKEQWEELRIPVLVQENLNLISKCLKR